MGYHILVVDDDLRLRDLICDILMEERTGDTIETTGSASEALEAMRRAPADVLITDWQMPGMDGLALIEAVQLDRPETHAILITTADRDEVKEHSRNRPASFALFTKPFSIEAFLTYIEQALSQRGRPVAARMPSTEKTLAEKGRCDSGRRLKPALKPALGLG